MGFKIVKGGKTKPVAKAAPKAAAKDHIDLFVEKWNKEMKGAGRIDRGRDITWLDPPRIRTGILGLDVISYGGLPRGGLVQFWGPWSSSKTTSAMLVMVAEQRAGRHVAFAVGEGFSKDWARQVGLWIPYSEDEYKAVADDAETTAGMEEFDEWGATSGFGTVTIFQHVHGDGLLELTAQAIKANIFAVIVIDSLPALKNARQLEEAEIGDEEQGGGGQITMFNRFVARCYSALNTKYDDENKIDMRGNNPNLTCVICINQARIKMGGQRRGGQVSYQPVGGEGLKHGWMLSVLFTRGEELGEEEQIGDKKRFGHWAVMINAKANKSKIGSEGRTAMWPLYIENHKEFKKGQIDIGQEVRIWGIYYNVIEQSGAWYTMPNKTRINSKDAVDQALREDADLRALVVEEVIARCRQ